MRLEGHGMGGAAIGLRHLDCRVDHRAMAQMHAVEIADRDHGAAARSDVGAIVTDDHKGVVLAMELGHEG